MKNKMDYVWLIIVFFVSPVYYPFVVSATDVWWCDWICFICFILTWVLGIAGTDQILNSIKENNK